MREEEALVEQHSKLESIEITNFMVYKHATACFDERGILNIKGYNNSGKSTFNLALAVCLMNLYASKQGNYIRHGERYFRIVVRFDDGISIVRDKYDNGQSLYEMYDDGVCVFTTKQGDKLAKVSGVPSPIKKYLDLIDTDLGYLNYQTCKDPLWLIETKGSENYNSLNEVLKTQEISRANAMLNSDINALNSDIAIIESDLQRKELQLESCKGVTQGLIDAISKKDLEVQALSSKDRKLSEMGKNTMEIMGIKVPEKVEEIDESQLRALEGILSTYNELSSIQISPEVDMMSSERLKDVVMIADTATDGDLVRDIPPVVESIDANKQHDLSLVFNELKQCVEVMKMLQALEEEGSTLAEEKKSFVESAKAEGKIFVECENCGTLMEVNTNEY